MFSAGDELKREYPKHLYAKHNAASLMVFFLRAVRTYRGPIGYSVTMRAGLATSKTPPSAVNCSA